MEDYNCVIFGSSEVGQSKGENVGNLVKIHFEVFKNHALTSYHQNSIIRVNNLLDVLEHKIISVEKQIEEYQKNRQL